MLVVAKNFISGPMIEDPSTRCALSDCQEPLSHPAAATQTPFALKHFTERATHGRAYGFSGEVGKFTGQGVCVVIFEV